MPELTQIDRKGQRSVWQTAWRKPLVLLVDGERLEGVGVKPDVPVADDLPYSEGRDPQLDRALAVAVERLKSR